MKLVIFGVAYMIMVIVMLIGNKKQWKWMDFDIPLEEKAFEKRYCMLLMPVIGFDIFFMLTEDNAHITALPIYWMFCSIIVFIEMLIISAIMQRANLLKMGKDGAKRIIGLMMLLSMAGRITSACFLGMILFVCKKKTKMLEECNDD